MKLRIEKSVTVITPSIVSSKLVDAIKSVDEQTYGNVCHLIVIDGPEHWEKLSELKEQLAKPRKNLFRFACLPFNTGANGFNGQRIYASYPHLVNTDYVFFLDEDNWYEPNHIESIINTIEDNNLDFAYSLRNVYTEDKTFVAQDNCESLGKWPIYFTHDNPQYLVDTSSYGFKRDFIRATCHLWHSGPWGEDRRYWYAVKDHARYDTTGLHTLDYRLGGNPNSVNSDFFIEGNKKQSEHYKDGFPWVKT